MTTAKKTPAKKTPAKKTPAKKAPAKKAPAKKAPVKKAPVKKAPVKKAPVKKAPAKKTTRAVAKVSPVKGKTLDWYVSSLPPWQQEVVGKIAALVASEAPKASVGIKWAQPVWEHFGPFAYVRGSKNHITFGFWRGAELADKHGILEGDGDRMKHLKITEGDALHASVRGFVREAVTLNEKRGDPTKR